MYGYFSLQKISKKTNISAIKLIHTTAYSHLDSYASNFTDFTRGAVRSLHLLNSVELTMAHVMKVCALVLALALLGGATPDPRRGRRNSRPRKVYNRPREPLQGTRIQRGPDPDSGRNFGKKSNNKDLL